MAARWEGQLLLMCRSLLVEGRVYENAKKWLQGDHPA